MSRKWNVFAIGPDRMLSLLRSMNEDGRLIFLSRLYEDGILNATPPPEIERFIADKNARIEAEQQKRQAEQDALRMAREKPDYKFPTLFRRDPFTCSEFVQTLSTDELEKLVTDISKNLQRWNSLLSHRVAEAVQILKTELNHRAVTKQPNSILDTLRNVLHEKKTEEPPKQGYSV